VVGTEEMEVLEPKLLLERERRQRS